ncbi:LAETG motif-containing sortase-dependent surface protein [Kitasatospora xanthocidica]|uniref:LAETG motif-containing sortase-dependent surface protein n=1 Tax=Kitasatospora xanthocidica TaxID=83382 RepID=UPI0036EC4046
MRTSRLLAASTLVALSLGATVGAASAGAVSVTPTPTPPPSATATAASPSAPAPTSASPSAGATTPAPTATTKPTNLPTPPVPAPSGGPCRSNLHKDIKVTGSGLAKTTLVKGGAAQEATVTFENDSPVDLKKVSAYFFFTDVVEAPVTNPVTWGKESFTIQVKLPGGEWKAPEPSTVTGSTSYLMVNLGENKIAKGGKLTFQVRLAATGKAVTGNYFAQLGASSETFEGKDVPGAPADLCLSYGGDYRVDDLFKVVDATATTTAAAPAGTAAPSPSGGPHLAETGSSSNTLPIALGGAAVLAVGAGTLVALRRRKSAAQS